VSARPVPALYIVTDRHATAGRPLTEVLARALEGIARAGVAGAAVAVQLREKDLGGAALLALARDVRRITAAAGAGLYVNDRADVALAAGADGVHLGGGSLSPFEIQSIAPELAVAISTHGEADVADVANVADVASVAKTAGTPNLAFVVLGPVFDTPSKRGYGPPLGTGVLRAAAKLPVPIVALGGVTPENARSCFLDGARGVACIRAILAALDPAEAVAAFLRGT